jgi:hypothetical protein
MAPAAAQAADCVAKDGPTVSADLQAVIDGASTGDTIIVTGTCVGNFAIPGGGTATNLTLQGKKMSISSNTLDGNGTGSVLTVGAGTTVHLKRLRIMNGTAFQGGGILNNGIVRLEKKNRVIGNTSTSDGGGIFNSGNLFLGGNTQISGNSAPGYGGGIYDNFGSVTMSGKAKVHDNSCGILGGGIYHDGGAVSGATAGGNVYDNTPNDISP